MPARFWLHLQADYDLQTALNEASAADAAGSGPPECIGTRPINVVLNWTEELKERVPTE